ncbi:hypothetical protein T12_1835, partial [Trichinella patagoniensis]
LAENYQTSRCAQTSTKSKNHSFIRHRQFYLI